MGGGGEETERRYWWEAGKNRKWEKVVGAVNAKLKMEQRISGVKEEAGVGGAES